MSSCDLNVRQYAWSAVRGAGPAAARMGATGRTSAAMVIRIRRFSLRLESAVSSSRSSTASAAIMVFLPIEILRDRDSAGGTISFARLA